MNSQIALPVPVTARRRVMLILSAIAMLLAMTFAVNVNAPAADAKSSTCTGASSTSISLAKSKYFVGCGWIQWSATSGKHRCDWASDGWHCSGPRNPKMQERNCHSLSHVTDINRAKEMYRINCAQRWDGNSGVHSCTYWSHRNSWTCKGPSNR